MKRLLSIAIVFSLLFSLLSIPNSDLGITYAKTTNPGATFAAVRWIKIGFDRDGLPLYPAKDVPWARSGVSWWGREGYPMPNAYLARETNGIAKPASITENRDESTVPVLWTEVYLSISPEASRSQEYDKWYAILDSAGQLWFDPDGTFHDPRYNPKADPTSSHYITGSCRTSSNKQNGVTRYTIDPTSDNNTQGPYILNPEHPFYTGKPIVLEINGTRFGNRKWQVGYVDMVDYPPERVIYDTNTDYTNKPNDENNIKFNPTTVIASQWDIGLRLVNFNKNPEAPQVPKEDDEMFHEYHSRTRNSNYDPYEYIYRKGPGNWSSDTYIDLFGEPSPYVQAGDTRLTDMSFKTRDGATVVNYPANSTVKPGDADCPYDYNNNGSFEPDECKALNYFANNIKHTETIEANGLFDTKIKFGYTSSEFIYKDTGTDNSGKVHTGRVDIGDLRYSPVNTKLDIIPLDPLDHNNWPRINHKPTLLNGTEPYSANDFERKKISTSFPYDYGKQSYIYGLGLVGWDALTKTQGDLLILSEILKGGCESPTYDISVETDAWMGTDVNIGVAEGEKPLIPSPTAARLRSPNGDIVANSQRIQKNTVLDPTGNSFFIPATTFHNVKLKYREYIGVEIFKDNGIDNHIGINLPENKLYEQNLSDDYMDERTGEEFLGAVNTVNAKDYGMPLQPFPDFIKFYDTNENGYGCGEPIYEIVDDPANYPDHDTVRGGDKRITGVTVNRNGNDITYPPDSIVAEGDADVGFNLSDFNASRYFFSDKAHPEKDIPFNNKYDLGEPIYYNKNYVDADMGNTFPYTTTYDGNLGKYVKPSQSNGHAAPGSGNPVPVYIDTDDNGIVGIGDIRITKVRNKGTYNVFYDAFSKVTEGDTDVGLHLTSVTKFGVLQWFEAYNRFDDIYIDVNEDDAVSGVSGKSPQDGADIRLTDTLGYTAGSTVYDINSDGLWEIGDDRDVGDQPDPTTYTHDYDLTGIAPIGVTSDGLFFADIDGDGMYSSDDVQLNPLKVESNYVRLTEVTISDTTYSCGSTVSTGDFWYFQNPISKISMGLNCDFRFFDGTVLPGPLGLSVKMDQFLKVEQTTQVDISLTTPLKQGEEVWILLEDVLAPNPVGGTVNPSTIVKKLDYENQLATFQFTPYRGSCGESSTNYPVRLYAFKDTGGVREPVPYDQYIDEYWAPFLPKDELGNIITGSDVPVPPSPPLPKELQNAYDCFAKLEYNVSPEDLKVSSAQKCLEVLYQKFPNLTVRLFDGDNPNDVNDPANVRISIPSGHNLIANYNAHGGGVDYLFTGYDASFSHPVANNPKEPGNLPQNEKALNTPNNHYGNKVIVQMNLDGTYYYWYWQDNSPEGVLDSGDIVAKSPIYPNDPDPDKNQPTYNKGYDRLTWENSDCSEKNTCLTCGGSDFRNMNIITKGDEFTLNGNVVFTVETFGVPSLVTNYGEITGGDPGGEIKIVVAPKDAVTKLKLRVYTMNAMYDYNSSIQHPPYFIYDTSPGIDYCGVKEFKVLPPDPYVNFAEFRIVDHALQNSEVNYTSGDQATSPLPYPTPQIQAPYDPIIKDVGKDFRCYPGGQTHTGRITGSVNNGSFIRSEGQHNGWNAYPAIWWWYWYDNVDYNNFTDFNRLGTEFFPLTDYSMYFILKNSDGEHLSFDWENTPLDRRLRKVVIEGPFMQPAIFNEEKKTEITEWEYNGVRGIPLKYDYSGKIVIDVTDWTDYQYLSGSDFTITQGFSGNQIYPKLNSYLLLSGDLDYTGLTDVFRIPEIIPIGFGVMTITVTLWDGTVKIYQDCCAEPPTDGVDSHGLSIVSNTKGITVGTDTKIEFTVKENEVMQTVQPANDAVVLVWQDRGILNKNTGLYDGAGDGWITNPPQSSDATGIQFQYDKINDLNGDGKVSFVDYETEIIGTYDLATNTWMSGVIDARTFQRDNGKYIFDLSATNGALVSTVGFDFGGKKNDPDHIISEFESLPVNVTAYKYGDDNNDRAFTPRFSIADNIPQFSHEVYLSGQAKIDVQPALDLSLTVAPTVITAGCIPELVDPASPLTLIVTDAEGNPVDLTKGVPDNKGNTLVEKDDIWNYLFDDPHPEPLPQYYWLRTDLHNDDGTKISNQKLYNKYFNPIKPDFTLSKTGKYSFTGFCANDAGEFDVYVYTPDRTHMGVAKVKVELPDVTYSIVNYDDPSGTEYTVPGEPDFVLTATDNRIYRVSITAKDARGLLIKGVTKGVSTCGGGMKNTARFTPYSSRPASWDFVERDKFLFAEHFLQDLYPFHLNIGYDFNDNTKIDWQNSELYTLGGLNNLYKGLVYYNTTNVMYDDLTWEITPNPNLPPVSDTVTRKPISEDPNEPRRTDNPTGFAAIGWGYGSIYNSPYHGGYLFSDIDNNGFLDYHDSLGLDVNGQTTFYIFAEDLCYIGGLVGQNAYDNNASEADLAGAPPPAKTDPAFVDKRFTPLYSHDGVFFLDWEAFPNHELTIAPPNLKVLDAENRVELSKDLLSKDNYDLIYSIENHIIVQVTPADSRDLPMKENGKVFLFGNQHQTAIYGNIKPSPEDPKIMETTIHFTPTGLGEGIASIGFYNLNNSYLKPPYDLKNTSTYVLMNLLKFDSNIGLYIEVFTDGPVIVNRDNELTVRVKEIGSLATVEGAKVVIEGASVKGTKTTDKQGTAIFPVKPTQTGIIKITAEKDGRVIGRKEVKVIDDLSRPFLDIDPLPPFTNKGEVEVTGYTNPGNTVTINNTVNATVDEKGKFSAKVTLKEGLNTIIVEAKNQRGEITKGSVSITLDTIPPNIFIDDPGHLVDVTEVEITGRTEPLCSVKVNGIPATLTHDIWKANVKVNLGTNKITVESTDRAGNTNKAEKEIYVYHRITMKLTIDNPVVLINNEPQPPLEYPPFISQGRTMVPVRIISEGLGADVKWDELTKTVTITLNNQTIIMTVGNSEVLVQGKKLLLDAPPVIKNGRTFVPLRFISEAFGAEVSWDEATRTVTVVYDK